MGPLYRLLHSLAVALAHAQVLQGQAPGLLVEQAQHHPFAVGRRQRRHADIDLAPADPQGNPPILRHALLGDVQPRHDLDPRHQQRRQFALGLHHLAQDAVDPEADHQALLESLDMDVGRVLPDRLAQQRIDQADDRRVVLLLQQVLGLLDMVGQAVQIHVLAQPFDHQHGVGRVVLIGVAQRLVERLRRQPLHGQGATGHALRFLQRRQRRAFTGTQPQAAFAIAQENPVASGESEGQAGGRQRTFEG